MVFGKSAIRIATGSLYRETQSSETYTGIEGINTQDHAVQESLGPIVDRSQEHLGSTDKAVIMARRLILNAVKTVQDGSNPPGWDGTYYAIRAAEKLLPRHADWRVALRNEIFGDSPDAPAETGA